MDSFLNSIKEAAENFSKLPFPIRILSHSDADGLTSAAILTKTLTSLDKSFVLSVTRKVTGSLLNELKKEAYKTYMFLDLGPLDLKEIEKNLKNRNIFVLDHHNVKNTVTTFIHLNPCLHNMDGNKEISTAGVCYLFSRHLDESIKESAYLALVGAIGDSQEDKGFTGLNKEILQNSLEEIEINKGLKILHSHTKPIYKAIQYTTDPYMPGITGSESASIRFLEELEIEKKRKLIHLSEQELKKLVTSIIIKMMGSETDEEVLGNIYLLKKQEEDSPIKDLKEFSILLNSCGRLHKPSLGIGACLGDEKSIGLAEELARNYKTELIKSLDWFYESKTSKSILEYPRLTIINAEDNVKDIFIGTLATIISKSNLYKQDTIIISLAHTLDNNTKISIRVSGKNSTLDVRKILENITKKLGFSSGGHHLAAGSLIPQEKEQEFIETVLESQKIQTESFITPTKSN